MKAKIDIKTPAGQSLEGFPKNLDTNLGFIMILGPVDCVNEGIVLCDYIQNNPLAALKLHPGDTITITIL